MPQLPNALVPDNEAAIEKSARRALCASSYTLTLRPSFPKIVHPGKSSYFKVLYTCYFASSITPGFSGHMMPLVLILQSLINNQDNFEQHLSIIGRHSCP